MPPKTKAPKAPKAPATDPVIPKTFREHIGAATKNAQVAQKHVESAASDLKGPLLEPVRTQVEYAGRLFLKAERALAECAKQLAG